MSNPTVINLLAALAAYWLFRNGVFLVGSYFVRRVLLAAFRLLAFTYVVFLLFDSPPVLRLYYPWPRVCPCPPSDPMEFLSRWGLQALLLLLGGLGALIAAIGLGRLASTLWERHLLWRELRASMQEH